MVVVRIPWRCLWIVVVGESVVRGSRVGVKHELRKATVHVEHRQLFALVLQQTKSLKQKLKFRASDNNYDNSVISCT